MEPSDVRVKRWVHPVQEKLVKLYSLNSGSTSLSEHVTVAIRAPGASVSGTSLLINHSMNHKQLEIDAYLLTRRQLKSNTFLKIVLTSLFWN